MAESSSDRPSLSSATDNESLYSSSDSLVSDDGGADHFPSLSLDAEVFPYLTLLPNQAQMSRLWLIVKMSFPVEWATQIGKFKHELLRVW